MEETTSTGGSATPTSAPATGTNATASAMQQPAALTTEELLKKLAEYEHKDRNATEELERHRKFRAAYDKKAAEEQAAKEAAEKEKLSEIERATRERDEALKTRTELEKQLKETKTNHAIVLAATAQGFYYPEAVTKLIESVGQIEYDEAGNPTNIDKLLDKLKKAMPKLLPDPVEQTQQLGTQSQTNQPQNAAPTIPPMAPGRTTIPAPGSNPPGKIPRLADLRRRP